MNIDEMVEAFVGPLRWKIEFLTKEVVGLREENKSLREAALAQPEQEENIWAFGVKYVRADLAQPEQLLTPEYVPVYSKSIPEMIGKSEQEPVAWLYQYTNPRREKAVGFYPSAENGVICTPFYTVPPQRKPLTDELIDVLVNAMVKGNKSGNWLCRAIEKAHGIKND